MTEKDFMDNLKKRFYWCYSNAEKEYLAKKGYKYLFCCTHFTTRKVFWVFDTSDYLLEDVKTWKATHRKQKESDSAGDGRQSHN